MFSHVKDLYRYINAEVLEDSSIDYLEFGVAKGTTMRAWSDINRQRGSRFFGFDSFIGLPEDWSKDAPKGTFSVGGIPPETGDPRVSFHVGWFQDTLPAFMHSYQPANRIVIHNDSDLDSSTLYTLTKLDSVITHKTIIIFDDAFDVLHEYRALVDYAASYRRRFQVIAATEHFCQIAVVFPDEPEARRNAD